MWLSCFYSFFFPLKQGYLKFKYAKLKKKRKKSFQMLILDRIKPQVCSQIAQYPIMEEGKLIALIITATLSITIFLVLNKMYCFFSMLVPVKWGFSENMSSSRKPVWFLPPINGLIFLIHITSNTGTKDDGSIRTQW